MKDASHCYSFRLFLSGLQFISGFKQVLLPNILLNYIDVTTTCVIFCWITSHFGI